MEVLGYVIFVAVVIFLYRVIRGSNRTNREKKESNQT